MGRPSRTAGVGAGIPPPGNVLLRARTTGLPKDSVANVSQLVTIDKGTLVERAGRLPKSKVGLILAGIDVVLDKGQCAGA